MPNINKLDSDKQRIRDVMQYRSGSDSCNSMYLGSIAKSKLYHLLQVPYGKQRFEVALAAADRKLVNALLSCCSSLLEYMKKHPMKICATCGQVIEA